MARPTPTRRAFLARIAPIKPARLGGGGDRHPPNQPVCGTARRPVAEAAHRAWLRPCLCCIGKDIRSFFGGGKGKGKKKGDGGAAGKGAGASAQDPPKKKSKSKAATPKKGSPKKKASSKKDVPVTVSLARTPCALPRAAPAAALGPGCVARHGWVTLLCVAPSPRPPHWRGPRR